MTNLNQIVNELNGYPVVRQRQHKNGYHTVMVKRGDEDYVVATWAPMMGSTWSWGHYVNHRIEANKVFDEVETRNEKRGTL